jgi:hypothetical protein
VQRVDAYVTAHPVFHQRESRELLSSVFDRIKFFDILPRDSRHREALKFAASLIFERLQSMRPDPGTPFGQTNGRTLIDYFEAYLARPDVVEQLKPLAILFTKISTVWQGMFQMAGAITQRAVESCPSTAYEPLLIERGVNPVLARGLASLAIRIGTRQADESRRLPEVVDAIRFLAKPGRRRRAVLRRAEVLLAAWEETSINETIFDDASLIELEFIGLLKSVVEGRAVAWRRLTEIAATIAPRLSIPRGSKISAASATHEVFLETVAELLAPRAYTRDPISEIYTDRWTAATRQEFHDPDFNPQAAHLRAKARRAAKKKPPLA